MTTMVKCPFCENGTHYHNECCGKPNVSYSSGIECCGIPVVYESECGGCEGRNVITEEFYMVLKLQGKIPEPFDFAGDENYSLKA